MKLHYRELGEGKPMVILHGLFGTSDNWQTIGKQLENDYCVHLIDLRNHGRSPWASPHNYDALAEDVILYIEERIGVPVLLMGHSMGGKTAMTLACKRPDLVERLVVPHSPTKSVSGARSCVLDTHKSR